MENSKLPIIGLAVLIIFGGGFYLLLSSNAANPTERDTSGTNTQNVTDAQGVPAGASKTGLIQVTSPRQNETVSQEFEVTGKARGYWYYEGSFPVIVIDNTGYSVAEGVAEAQGSWTTTDYVPFVAKIKLLSTPKSNSGYIRLKKDDPSGKNPDAIEIPIRFK
jgi:hypothetical protein